jgi:cyclopropane-fatty-acyl-phospholipid synthase
MSTTEEGSRGSLRLKTPLPPFADSEGADAQAQGESSSLRARMLRALLEAFGNPRVAIELWSGERVSASAEPVATLKVSDRSTFLKLCADPDLQFGDAYSEGRIGVEGDLKALLEELYRGAESGQGSVTLARRLASTLHRRPSNTLIGSRDNIHRHYDIGNEFYSLWLGPTMSYTCAYFPTPEATLEQAQIAKMDHVCRKVQLKPDDLVVEAGCGWGGLALHMARNFGARVRAFNISHEQIMYARERAKEQGLADRVEFVEDDYRNITGHYDVFMSVGMLEHVGVENYPELGRVIGRSLRSNGRGLIHTIGRNRPKPMHRWIDRRIFPGANPPSLKQMMDIFEERNFSVLDVENLRLHYAKTLQEWYTNFEREVIKVSQMFDDKFVRMWRLYLLGSEAAFTTGELQLFQVAFAPGRSNDVPMTREHLYCA